jgi:hypothetical protein
MRRAVGLLLLLLLVIPLAVAKADPLVPTRSTAAPSYGQHPPLYDDPRYEPWAYTFEGQQSGSVGYITIYFWMNQMQVTKAWMLKSALRISEYAVNDSLIAPLLTKAGGTLDGLGDLLWSADGAPLVVGALAVVGMWGLFLHLSGRVRRVWGLLGGSVLIILVAAVVLTSGQNAANTGGELARAMTVQVVGAVDRVAPGDGTLTMRSGDAAWRALVYEPWLTGELSEQGQSQFRSTDGVDGGDFLGKTITQRNNSCLYNFSHGAALCPWWEIDFLTRRMLLTTWTFMATLVYAGVITALSAGIILAQVTVLFFLALAPLWLLLALWWPDGGLRLLRVGVLRVGGALVSQVVLAGTLAVLMLLTEAMATIYSVGGWMFQSLLLVGLAVAAFRFRRLWTMPLTTVIERFRGRRAVRGERVRADVRVVGEKPAGGPVHSGDLPDYVRTYQPQPEAVVQVQQQAQSIQRERFQEQITRVREELQVKQEAWVEHQRAPAFVEAGEGAGRPQRAPPRAGVGARASPQSSTVNIPAQRPRA